MKNSVFNAGNWRGHIIAQAEKKASSLAQQSVSKSCVMFAYEPKVPKVLTDRTKR
ncbi:cyclic lactone autoinducer peptide [Listeria booriae]|uniref:cyclic lactone autoinducer peptide n=1 Tax=Listeria booriae TaxID=1552123 RepID=UPI001629BCD5|nr:cyclic lactone autoinducer peptide [Listeria booriae]MBC1919175.1 cyclic lactone autoinducer peptide [Listeria booriae]MBC2105705.1 cyclic lactone autoinducer peptide [Listeria booriae]